jgi:GT2 family glycosyltransferase
VARAENGGFARALTTGIAAARHRLVFAMNSDVRIRPGFLEPLIAALDAPGVFAAVPRILLDGRETAVESLVRIDVERGLARVAQPALEGDLRSIKCLQEGSVHVPFGIGGACLFRRDDFERLGGFDPAFEPFYLEDLDLGWRAWQADETSVLVPSSVVEHHHRGTIGAWVGPEVVRAAIERNLLLFQWKHMDTPELLRDHLAALAERAAAAWFTDDREALVWIALAIERAPAVLAARAALGNARSRFADVVRDSDPCPPKEISP